MPVPFADAMPPKSPYGGTVRGVLVKQNTTHSTSDYAKKVYCVLTGYTLWEYDDEAAARAGLWPKAEADVIGVSPAPANSSSLRSTLFASSSSRPKDETARTFVYTTTAGERVCAVATSEAECAKWLVGLTLAVELLVLGGLPDGAGGAAQRRPHEPPTPDDRATHCSASGVAFGYTVARHTCAASGRAYAASHMAPAGLPLPGIGRGRAEKLSDAAAQAQQLLNVARSRARLLAASAHAAALEQTLERKFRTDRRALWLLHHEDSGRIDPKLDPAGHAWPREEAAQAARQILLDRSQPLSDPEYDALFNTCRAAAKDACDRAYDAWRAQVLLPVQGDAAGLVGEFHFLTLDDDLVEEPSVPKKAKKARPSPSKRPPRPPSPPSAMEALQDQSQKTLAAAKGVDEGAPDPRVDDRDAARRASNALMRRRLPRSARLVAVKDVLAELASYDENGPPLLFYLPQLAHVYYRTLPPLDGDAALRSTLAEEFLLRVARRSFRFALQLAWLLVSYLEDRAGAASRRPHVLRLLVELEAAAAYAASNAGGGVVAERSGDPWALRRDAVAAAAMSRRGPLLTGDTSPFAGSVALELLPRTPPWLALELRRSAGALRRTAALALATLGVEPAAPPPPPSPRWIKSPSNRAVYGAHDADHSDGLAGPPDDVLAREMRFVRALCDVAEAMRGVDGSSRPARLRKELEALPRRTPLAHAPFGYEGRLGRVARVPPREGHVFKTKARAPTLVLLETVDDPVAEVEVRVREEDSESDDDKPPMRRPTPAQNHPEFAALLREAVGDEPVVSAPESDDESRTSLDAAGELIDESLPTPSTSQELTGDMLKRVKSVPSIVECSYGADDAALASAEGPSSKAASVPTPPRRVPSSTDLATLVEADTPLDGEEPTPVRQASPRTLNTPEVSQPDFAAALDEPPPPPVASGYSPRWDVVRALRRKQALGLKTERLDSSLQDTPQPSPIEKKDSMEETGPNKVEQPGFGEPWAVQRARVRRQSPIGDEATWNLVSCIVKSNDDLRQEVCALQIIAACDDAFRSAGLAGDRTGLWLKHYSIVPTGASTGIVEVMTDAVSLDSLKKSKGFKNIASHLGNAHGPPGSRRHLRARRAFVSSMAAYSLVSHLLGLKDRHNGNILLDNKGHVIHIDFGFLLGQAPGGSFSLERVPFKLTAEHVEAMGGWSSDGFADFVVLLCCGFAALQKHSSKILALVEVMARDSPFPCFKTGTAAVEKMRARLKLHLTTNEQVSAHVADLVRQSYNAYGTRQYDSFQYLTNGIYS